MKKDIEWFNNEVEKRINRIKTGEVSFLGGDLYGEGYIYGMREVQAIANQLDEPEVLSQKWIDRHTYYEDEYDFYYADPDELKNLLVPKQEKVKVPEVVADWIEAEKRRNNSLGYSLYKLEGFGDVDNEDVDCWVKAEGSTEKLARAWLDGYVVEEEQKYLVNILDEGIGAYLIYYPKSGNYGVTGILDDNKGITQFTEQEIKDYDKRFWPFAVKVEELEE